MKKCHFYAKADNLFPDSKELSLITSWKVISFFTLNLFLYFTERVLELRYLKY